MSTTASLESIKSQKALLEQQALELETKKRELELSLKREENILIATRKLEKRVNFEVKKALFVKEFYNQLNSIAPGKYVLAESPTIIREDVKEYHRQGDLATWSTVWEDSKTVASYQIRHIDAGTYNSLYADRPRDYRSSDIPTFVIYINGFDASYRGYKSAKTVHGIVEKFFNKQNAAKAKETKKEFLLRESVKALTPFVKSAVAKVNGKFHMKEYREEVVVECELSNGVRASIRPFLNSAGDIGFYLPILEAGSTKLSPFELLKVYGSIEVPA